jgi:hypothetical protein
MTLVQFLAIGFVILALIKTASDFKKKRIGVKSLVFWALIWVAVAVVAVLPYVTAPLAKILGIGRGIDVVVYFSILSIFFILFKIISKLTKIDKDITEIVQHLSLKNPKKK